MRIPGDGYIWAARVCPVLIVALPVGLATYAWVPDVFSGSNMAWPVTLFGGVALLLAQLGRDRGRDREPFLFSLWHGKPTTRMLRHRDTTYDSITLTRYHDKLGAATGCRAPTPDEELIDPEASDEVYESYVEFLKERTRDHDLIRSENTSYGFRRNVWGLRPVGVVLSLAGTVAAALAFLGPCGTTWVVPGIINLLLSVFWLVRVNPDWVRIAADAYAQRLVASADSL